MNRRGLTLLELVLAAGLIGLASQWALVRLGDPGERSVAIASRRLADELSLARDRAILAQHTTTMVFDLDRQEWRGSDGPPVRLPPSVRLAAVTIQGGSPVAAGSVTLSLAPTGDRLPTSVLLRGDRGHAARVELPAARGRATVHRQERS